MQGDVFFVLSKVAWALLRIDTLLILLCALGVVVRGRWGRHCLVTGCGLILLIGIFPLHTLLLHPLETRFAPAPEVGTVSGIIQLGGAESGTGPTPKTPQVNAAADRYLATLALAQAHPDAQVLFSGGGAQLRATGGEAKIARRLLVAAGLPEDRLQLENRSRNTAENAAFARHHAPDHLSGQWLLVTSAFHMPRAVGAFCEAGWGHLVPWPVDYRGGRFRARWDPVGHLAELNVAIREWIGLLAYRATGRTGTLFPDGC